MPSNVDREVEDMEKFMSILMDVKVSLAEQNGKLDNLLDMKEQIKETAEIATNADYRSTTNKEAIDKMSKAVREKASKDDVEKIVKQRENTFKNLPSWIALAISLAVFILTYLGGQ
ncbi:hypothetical protein JNUCC1_03367 [Lentibacillus sp. JNUCC-1]|uniref:hypothetical protein n=1 Tax=Lentibacillus sp. JNUCC-1 TaxID=2654513 RepID=UPI0012E97E26|nr:hypothetical protein [Lentibacillus sp. JNUCC-1]MUV39489.1 hypothetical protein [Lentibacillus sp. JNUCC-1]